MAASENCGSLLQLRSSLPARALNLTTEGSTSTELHYTLRVRSSFSRAFSSLLALAAVFYGIFFFIDALWTYV